MFNTFSKNDLGFYFINKLKKTNKIKEIEKKLYNEFISEKLTKYNEFIINNYYADNLTKIFFKKFKDLNLMNIEYLNKLFTNNQLENVIYNYIDDFQKDFFLNVLKKDYKLILFGNKNEMENFIKLKVYEKNISNEMIKTTLKTFPEFKKLKNNILKFYEKILQMYDIKISEEEFEKIREKINNNYYFIEINKINKNILKENISIYYSYILNIIDNIIIDKNNKKNIVLINKILKINDSRIFIENVFDFTKSYLYIYYYYFSPFEKNKFNNIFINYLKYYLEKNKTYI